LKIAISQIDLYLLVLAIKVRYAYAKASIVAKVDDTANFKMKGCCDAPKAKSPCNMDNPPPNILCQSGKKGGAVYLSRR
jgi:hypothetical protein